MTTVLGTDLDLALDAYGGKVHQGDPCWLVDEWEYTVIRIESAVIVREQSDTKLYHGDRLHHGFLVYASEEAATERLKTSAIFARDYHAKAIEKANRFLLSQQ